MASATDPSRMHGGGGAIDRATLARSVRSAAAECYGVTDVVAAGRLQRLAGRLRPQRSGGVTIGFGPPLRVMVDLRVAAHVPRAQVVANVSDAVRYRVLRDFGRAIDELIIRVDGTPVSSDQRPSDPGT